MRTGYWSVGSYQRAGRPFMTGSTDIDNGVQHRIRFPFVTRSITVVNTDTGDAADLRVHFHSYSADITSGHHYFTLTQNNDSITMNVAATEIYITSQANDGQYEIFAELTQIPTGSMYKLTGSGITA